MSRDRRIHQSLDQVDLTILSLPRIRCTVGKQLHELGSAYNRRRLGRGGFSCDNPYGLISLCKNRKERRYNNKIFMYNSDSCFRKYIDTIDISIDNRY